MAIKPLAFIFRRGWSAMECRRCQGEPVIFLRYAGRRLCRRHFLAWVAETVSRELRRQLRALEGRRLRDRAALRLGIALSGGKDSTVMLHLATDWARQRRLAVVALAVDEGLPDYRPPSLTLAAQHCATLEVELHTGAFRDIIGEGLTELVARQPPRASPCSPCGVLRRRALNRLAREAEVDVLLLGHNLDDCAQTVLMNHARGDVDRLLRMAPHLHRQPGLVPRLLPLRRVPEREVMLYALLAGIAFHDGTCPYAGAAQRNTFRETLLRLESQTPGTRHALLRGADRIRERLGPPRPLVPCPECDEPAGGGICRFCRDFGTGARPAGGAIP